MSQHDLACCHGGCHDCRVPRLHPKEPAVPAWECLSDKGFREQVWRLSGSGERRLILIDGRSAGGKTTLAESLAVLLSGTVVHTDDVAWHLHPTEWDDELVRGVIAPWRAGKCVRFRPPGWIAKGRPGAVEVPASAEVLIVEGVGAGRESLVEQADLVIWVQSDRDEARRRGIARDIELGREPAEAEQFWDEWTQSEEPFLAAERPWTRAHLIVNGTATGDGHQIATGPLRALTQGPSVSQ